MSRAGARLLTLLAVAAASALSPRAGAAGAPPQAPTVTVDRPSMRPGDTVVVSLDGWRADVVTLSVCANEAARGSTDCNMVASEGIRRNRDGSTTRRDFVVSAPEGTCPCVLRASTATNDEVALAPIDLLGHPTGPVVLPATAPRLEVTVQAARAPAGLLSALRAALGGPTAYDVTVTVRNPTSRPIAHVALAGSARGRRGDVDALELPDLGPLGPGERRSERVRSEVPAPAIGTFRWEATASGSGAPTTATTRTRHLPPLFAGLVLVLAADVAAIAGRRLAARRAAPPAGSGDEDDRASSPVDPVLSGAVGAR